MTPEGRLLYNEYENNYTTTIYNDIYIYIYICA